MPSNPIAAITAALILFGSFHATAEEKPWKLDASTTERSPGARTKLVKATLSRKVQDGKPQKATIQLLIFDTRSTKLKIIDQGNTPHTRQHSDLGAAMKAHACLAGCNASFFHPDFRPLGLVVADGSRSHKFESSKLLSGVLFNDTNKGLQLVRRATFKDSPSIDQLVQAGPFLVDKSTPVAGLSAKKQRRRTFIATDGTHRWAIGTTSALSLADLGKILASQPVAAGLKFKRALNLDGGSSSGFWVAKDAKNTRPLYVREWARVRNFIGIVPRDKS